MVTGAARLLLLLVVPIRLVPPHELVPVPLVPPHEVALFRCRTVGLSRCDRQTAYVALYACSYVGR